MDKVLSKINNPLQTFLYICAAVAAVVGVVNFFNINAIKPLDARISAVEARQDRQGELMQGLATKEDLRIGVQNINTRIDDLKDSVNQVLKPLAER